MDFVEGFSRRTSFHVQLITIAGGDKIVALAKPVCNPHQLHVILAGLNVGTQDPPPPVRPGLFLGRLVLYMWKEGGQTSAKKKRKKKYRFKISAYSEDIATCSVHANGLLRLQSARMEYFAAAVSIEYRGNGEFQKFFH